MKKSCSIAILLAVISLSMFFLSQNLYSQAARQQLIRDVSVKIDTVETPIWKVINVMERSGITARRWLQADIDFTTGASAKQNESLDNLVAEFELLLPIDDGKNIVLLSGKATYWAVSLDGQTHHIVAFVPPRILEKFMGLKALKSMSGNDAKKLEFKVIFKYNDAEIATGYQVPRSSTEGKVKDRFEAAKRLPGLVRQKDAIFGQDKTPWAFLNYDYYEQVNSDAK